MRARLAVLVLAAAAITAVGLLWPGPAAADGPTGDAGQVVLEGVPPAAPAAGQESVILSARVHARDGQALGGVPVTFYVLTDVFGERLMKVGEAPTDSSGVASLVYRPSWEGDHTVVVRLAAEGTQAPAQTTFQFDFAGPVPLHENAPFGLEGVRRWLPLAVGTVVLAVWAILGLVLGRTVLGIPAAAAAAQTMHQPLPIPSPIRPATARGGLVLLALVVLAAAPVAWFVLEGRGRDELSVSTRPAQFAGGEGVSGEGQEAQGGALLPQKALPATLVHSVTLVETGAGGQPTLASADLPADVAVIDGRAFVLDTNRGRILAMTKESQPASMFESDRQAATWLGGALAVTAHDGRLYVANTAAGNVVVVAPPGEVEEVIVPQAPPGERPLRPGGIAVTEDGDIWLSDTENHRVLLLSARGELLGSIGAGAESSGDYGFSAPSGLALDELGNLYVADAGNGLVKKYSPLGVFLEAIGEGMLAAPRAVAVDAAGDVFVSDEKLSSVAVFAPGGGYLGSISRVDPADDGSAPWFQVPYGLKVDGEQLYVMDRLVGLLVFDLGGGGLSP